MEVVPDHFCEVCARDGFERSERRPENLSGAKDRVAPPRSLCGSGT